MKTKLVEVDKLGEPSIDSPLKGKKRATFVTENASVVYNVHMDELCGEHSLDGVRFFPLAGPREKIYFDPKDLVCGIVTCGGLCPGLNDVIRAIVIDLNQRYGVTDVLGFRYGYKGLTKDAQFPPVALTPDSVDDIHHLGGTVLSSSRGPQDINEMIDVLLEKKVKILFTIGGDGTMRGASDIASRIKERGLDIAVVAIPKTIDNDINYVKMSFGFQTAVQESMTSISCAHIEAKGAPNGVGLVKLMGRHSGYIAAHATLANSDVNFCLIPEAPFLMNGEGGFLEVLRDRLESKHHAVIVVAEGAGQNLIKGLPPKEGESPTDASGNVRLKDIGHYLKEEIENYLEATGMEVNVKYIDPSYTIRSVPANAFDSEYCLTLGQNAVHAGISGKTDVVIGFWNGHFIHVPIPMAIEKRDKVNPNRRLWKTVMEATCQPESMFEV